MKKLIFVADAIHLKSEIPGGVQICTNEYIDLLKESGFDVVTFGVIHTKRIFIRLKIKLGIELYERYDFKEIFEELKKKIALENIKYIALNQIDFIGLTPLIRKYFGNSVSIIALSHGNESGDFLHHIVRNNQNYFTKLRNIIRLGFSIYKESKNFIENIDLVCSISDTEKQINNWLGAKKSVFVPRELKPEFLNWSPVINRLGFVGTLNHKPNIDGLIMLLDEIKKEGNTNLAVHVVGGPVVDGKKLEKEYHFVKYMGHKSNEELRKEAESWSIFLNPIFWYSRGASTKLAQGISWGIPIASTEAGNRGYFWKKGNVLISSSAKEMLQQIKENASIEALSILSQDVKTIATHSFSIKEIANELNLKNILTR